MPKFYELKVVKLRRELNDGEDSTGLKKILQDRIRQVMIQNGEVPDSFEFESSDFERLEAKMERNSIELKKDIEKLKNNTATLEANLEEKVEQNAKELKKRIEQNVVGFQHYLVSEME